MNDWHSNCYKGEEKWKILSCDCDKGEGKKLHDKLIINTATVTKARRKWKSSSQQMNNVDLDSLTRHTIEKWIRMYVCEWRCFKRGLEPYAVHIFFNGWIESIEAFGRKWVDSIHQCSWSKWYSQLKHSEEAGLVYYYVIESRVNRSIPRKLGWL